MNAMIEHEARKTGMPVKASAKFWAEHQGLGYHQADIRETEYPRKGVTGTFAVSSGERNFTRYGYIATFYRKDSSIDVLYRKFGPARRGTCCGPIRHWAFWIWPSGELLWSGRYGALRTADFQRPRRIRPSWGTQLLRGLIACEH